VWWLFDWREREAACRSCTHKCGPAIGLDRTVVSIVHCGCTDPGSIPGLDILPCPFAHFARPRTPQESFHLSHHEKKQSTIPVQEYYASTHKTKLMALTPIKTGRQYCLGYFFPSQYFLRATKYFIMQ
jgi:hypothetical protein